MTEEENRAFDHLVERVASLEKIANLHNVTLGVQRQLIEDLCYGRPADRRGGGGTAAQHEAATTGLPPG